MLIYLLGTICLIACGVLAAAPLIVARQPSAKQAINKMAPFQGILGIILLVLGLLAGINFLTHLGALTDAPIRGLIALAAIVVEIALGFLCAYPLIAQATGGAGSELRAKLQSYSTTLGIAGIVLGILALINYFA